MTSLSFALTGVMLGLAAGVAPGPLLALVLTQSVRYGALEGIKVAVAPLITDLPIILGSVLLLTVLATTDVVLAFVTLGGAVFLGYLAYDALTVRVADREVRSQVGSLWKGIGANLLNPHPYLFWVMVGAPTLLKAAASGPLAVGMFLGGLYLCLVGAKVLVALSAGAGRQVLDTPWYLGTVRLLGVAMAGLAVLFLRDAVRYLR